MVTTFYPPYYLGGDALYVYRLSQALAERGHEVDVVHSIDAYALQHPAAPPFEFSSHPGVRRFPLESSRPGLGTLVAHQLGRPGLYSRGIRAVLEARRPDVIHFHNVSLMGAPGVLALGNAVKLYSAHEYWLVCPTHVLFRFDQEACAHRDCLQCTVVHYRRPPQLWRHTGALRRGLRHVDCLLFPSRFALQKHQAQGIGRRMEHLPNLVQHPGPVVGSIEVPTRPYFLFVGRLEKLKGVQDLLRLFVDYKEADLLIAGAGSHEAALREQARGLEHVRFLGLLHPAALAALYRDAISVLVPSLCFETFGLTAAEGMLQGTPVIARRIGALAENVAQSGGGLTFDTLEECRTAMERLRTEPGLRESLGRSGREAAERLWSTEAHLTRYLRIVDELSEQRAHARPRRTEALAPTR